MNREQRMLEFGSELFKCRERSQISQENLAEHLGVHSATISAWELGKTFPSKANFNKLAEEYEALNTEEFRRIILREEPPPGNHKATSKPGPRGPNANPPNRVHMSKKLTTETLEQFERKLDQGFFKSRRGARVAATRRYNSGDPGWTEEAYGTMLAKISTHGVWNRKLQQLQLHHARTEESLDDEPTLRTIYEQIKKNGRRLTKNQQDASFTTELLRTMESMNWKLNQIIDMLTPADESGFTPAPNNLPPWVPQGQGRWKDTVRNSMWIDEEQLLYEVEDGGILKSDYHGTPYSFELSKATLRNLAKMAGVAFKDTNIDGTRYQMLYDAAPSSYQKLFKQIQQWVLLGAPQVVEGSFDLNDAREKLEGLLGDKKAAHEQLIRAMAFDVS